MKMVVQMGKYYPPYFGGVERVTKQCADAFAELCSVRVVCHNVKRQTEIEQDGRVHIVRCGTQYAPFRQPISLMMALHLAKGPIDLIHFHAPNFWGAALIWLLRPKTPLIIWHHCDVEGRGALRSILMPVYRNLLRRAEKVFVSSAKNAKMSRDLYCDPSKIVAIPFGLDPDIYSSCKEPDRPWNSTNEPRILFGFIGRLVWYKGLEILLEAFAKTRGADLLIVGDGPLRAKLRRLIVDLKLADRVRMTGQVSEDEKIRLLQSMDVFVLPSTNITETFGIVQIEAQMCGVPCISSNLPTGVSDITDDGVTGILVEPGDVDGLASAMSRLIEDRDLRQRLSKQSKEKARAVYSERAFKENFLREVKPLLAR